MQTHYLGELENSYNTVANILRTITTKFYQNRLDFVDDVTKTFGVFFGFAVLVAFTYKTQR